VNVLRPGGSHRRACRPSRGGGAGFRDLKGLPPAKAGPRGRPFGKGESGNPGGRPKGVGEIRDLARQYTAAAVATLVEICENWRNESARVAAASALLDRGWGKASVSADDPSLAEAPQQLIAIRFVGAEPVGTLEAPMIEGKATKVLPAPAVAWRQR
jgi:hypothetical protein